jgi:predicted phosphodiesterase
MWRFAHVTDPHLASHRDGEWNNRFICSMMPELMACLKKDLHRHAPEFILATGDICSHQTRDAMFEARDLMDDIEIPYYPMGGNHDFVKPDSRAWFIEAFQKHLPDGNTYFSFSHKNLHFIVLEPWWKWADGTLCPFSEASVAAELDMTLKDAYWVLPPAQFDWMQDDLDRHQGIPTVMASHYPAVPVPPRMQRPGYKDSGPLDNGDMLIKFLEKYPQVFTIFSGHMHMHYIEQIGTIHQVVTGALPEFPIEFRIIDVYNDRLEITTHGLSDPSFVKRSLIPGKEWTRGEERDRSATIPFLP